MPLTASYYYKAETCCCIRLVRLCSDSNPPKSDILTAITAG